MREIRISYRGLVSALGAVIVFLLWVTTIGVGVTMAYLIGAVIFHEADASWLPVIGYVIAGIVGFVVLLFGFSWLYDANPTIKIGGKPKPKSKLPKATARNVGK